MPADTDTLIFEGEALKTLPDAPEGKVKVGGYAIRFSDASEKDLTGEFFTKATKFGKNHGDGAMTLFHHGMPVKGLENLCDADFESATTRVDDAGIWAETTLDLRDEYQKKIADMIESGALNWSSGSAGHAMRKKSSGEITRWPISEFSFTPTPAEPRLPAIRPLKSLSEPAPIVDTPKAPVATPPKIIVMPEATKTAEELAAETARAIEDGIKARELVVEEIRAIGKSFNVGEDTDKFIRDRKPVQAFKDHVFEMLKTRGDLKAVDLNRGVIGADPKDIREYRLMKAIRDISNGKGISGREKEFHDAAAKTYQGEINERTIIVPEDVKRSWNVKAQNVTAATAGGFLVQQQWMPITELLRNKTRVIEAGATQIGGLVGDVIIPQHVSGAVAYWVSETGALTDSQSVFAQKKMTPHRLGATIPYSTQFINQISLDAESFIRDDATKVLGIEVDRSALLGSGVAGEPLGVANCTDAILGTGRGINQTVTYGAAATWAKVVEHETGIADDNADFDTMAFILGVTTVGKWKTILKDSVAGALYLLGDNMMANGYRVLRSKQVGSAAQSFFGAWSQLLLGTWAGMSVIVDPFALKKSGQVEITFNEMRDHLIRQPLAFNVSTDSAAQ